MKDKNSNIYLKGKVALGYLLIFMASAFAILFLYKGIKNLQILEQSHTVPNVKLRKINQITTLIYEAENKNRTYFLLRNKTYYEEYMRTLDSIGVHIDSLSLICQDNPEEVSRLNTIRDLLEQKKAVVKQLSFLKSTSRRNKLYDRAMEELYIQAYELSKVPKVIKEKVIITRDSFIYEPEKKNISQRFKSFFSSKKEQPKTLPKVTVEYSTKTDSVIQEGITPDTVVKTLQQALNNLRLRENYLQDQSLSSETKLLYNDQILLDQIRQIATLLENDEIKRINQALSNSSNILRRASDVTILLVIISVVVIIFFLILIFRDISLGRKNQLALQAAKQQTENMMKLKEQFMANMSHEIRTPLGIIIGFTEQLQKTKLSDQQQQFLGTIDKASSHLLDVVNDILDLSKIEAGKFVLERIQFNPHCLLEDICQSFSLKALEKNIEIRCNIDKALDCSLVGDPFRIQQVLINIIGNAVKFTDQGNITVNAGISYRDEKKIVIRISIADTGIGIDPAKQKEIFQDFTQADNGTARKYGGTGLGLAISERIVHLHGGKISLESTPGKGSTFTIKLPLNVPSVLEKPESHPAVQPDRTISQLLSTLKNKRILVVEDDEVTLLLISSLLEDVGTLTTALTDSVKAQAIVKENLFDLVITDINMPRISGIQFLKFIRSNSNPSVANVPVIALTANVTDKEYLLKEGFTAYLTKPFKEEAFYKKIISVLTSDSSLDSSLFSGNGSYYNDSNGASYSLDEIYAFTGDDPDALKLVVSTFVQKTLLTFDEIKELTNTNDMEGISFRAHKLLTSFRQFKIGELVPVLEKLEKYKELDLPAGDCISFANNIIERGESIVKQIEKEVVNIE